MIIYKCLITGDEMFSDCFKITTSEDGLFYEVEGKSVIRKEGEIDDKLIGGNASAEQASEGTETLSVSGVDIVLNHKLSQIEPYSRKAYLSYLKDYMKALKKRLMEDGLTPEQLADFQAEAEKAGKKMMDMVKSGNFDFYMGESRSADGMLPMLNYREDGATPYMVFMKCGLEVEKC